MTFAVVQLSVSQGNGNRLAPVEGMAFLGGVTAQHPDSLEPFIRVRNDGRPFFHHLKHQLNPPDGVR